MLALIHFLMAYHITIGPTFRLARTHALRPQEMVSAAPGSVPVGIVVTWRIRFD